MTASRLSKLRSAVALAVFLYRKHDIGIVCDGWRPPSLTERCLAGLFGSGAARMRPIPPIKLNTYGKPFPRDPFELEMQMAELRGAARVKLSKLLSHARLWTDSRGVRIKALRMTPAELSEAMLTGFVHWGINGAQVAGIRIEIKR